MKKLCKLLILAAVLCFGMGLVLCFAMIGYGFSGMCAFGAGALCLIFWLSLRWDRPWTRIFRRALLGVLCVGMVMGLVSLSVVIGASAGQEAGDCRYIVVLGAAVHGDVPSLSLRERMDAAVDYLNGHPDTLCIVSGGKGSGENISEAECMVGYLTSRGIDPARIIPEDQATSTAENLAFSKALMEHPDARVGVVSSEYHLYRAIRMAKDLGLDAVGIPAHTSRFSLRVNYTLREAAAVWYYWIIGG